MTTIAVAVKDGVAAIGADTMSKSGYTNERAGHVVNHSKIITVGDSYFAITGPTSGKLALSHYFARLNESPVLDTPEAIYAV